MARERMNRRIVPAAFLRNRKKAGLAAAMVVVMAIMWGRVLTGHKPQAAAAAPTPAAAKSAADQVTPVKVAYLNLPVIAGRNDTIQHDFFTGREWSDFPRNAGSKTGTVTEVVRTNTDRTSEIEKVAKKLNLQVIVPTGNPQALINDQLVQVGDTVGVQETSDLYVFEVKRIANDAVLVECGGKSVTLKMK